MKLPPRCRFSLRVWLAGTTVIAVLICMAVERHEKQVEAAEFIRARGGLVASFDEWIVIGNSGAIERDLPLCARSQQINWHVNLPVREVQIDAADYTEQMREAIRALPTIERVHLLGPGASETARLVEKDFPGTETLDVSTFMQSSCDEPRRLTRVARQ